MVNEIKSLGWTWIDSVFLAVRGVWFIIWLIIFLNNTFFYHLGISLLVQLIWLCIAYLVPQVFIIHKKANPRLYPLTEMMITGSLYVYLFVIEESDSSIMLIPAVILGFYFSRNFIWGSSLAGIILIPLACILLDRGYLVVNLTHVLNNGIAIGVGFAFNRVVLLLKQNQKQYQLIQEQNRTLEQYSQKIESLTLLEERNRMARELHDTLGHTFTSVIIGMDGVMANITRADYEKALKKLSALRKLTKSGLDEIRKNIHQIAPIQDNIWLSKSLSELVREFALHTETTVTFHTIGSEYEVNQAMKLTFIRCLQEALTNAKRHGKAQSIHVTIEFQMEGLFLKIKDDGLGSNELKFGFGLKGMKERLQNLHGEIIVKSGVEMGTEIICSIPRGKTIDQISCS